MAQGRSRLIAVVVLLLLAASIGAGVWWMSGDDKRAARGACYEAVKAKIGQPGSATFTDEYVGEKNGVWMVAGHVDADRRYRFDCDVKDGAVTNAFVI